MKFSFTAKHADGKTFKDTREYADKFALFHDIKKGGDVLIEFKESGNDDAWWNHVDVIFSKIFGSVKMQEKIGFARNLSNMLDAGLALSRSLNVMERQTKNKKIKAIYSHLNELISQGKTFHEALAEYPRVFNQLFVSMVRAGEESGTLAASLKEVSEQMEKTYMLKKKIKGAMMYPGVIFTVMIIIGILMMILVVPRLTATFEDLKVELPTSTKVIIFMSHVCKDYWPQGIGVLIILGSLLYAAARTPAGKKTFDFIFLHLPIVGELVKQTNTAQTARTLSSLLHSGVDVMLASQITGDVVGNSFYKKVLYDMKEKIEKGAPMSESFLENEHLYPVFVGEMVSVGEETGRLAIMLQGVAVFYEGEVEQKTKDMSTLIEPLLMVVIGGAVGFFAVAMITPTYSVLNNI